MHEYISLLFHVFLSPAIRLSPTFPQVCSNASGSLPIIVRDEPVVYAPGRMDETNKQPAPTPPIPKPLR